MSVVVDHNPERNCYEELVINQKYALIPAFTLESGDRLEAVPLAYKTWGRLNSTHENVLVLCHALSGSSDAEDWWRPLMGPGKAFDYDRYFIFCANMLGSPYGSASPLTINPSTGNPYGPDFPLTTSRDDVRIQKVLLDALGVRGVAAVVGGSMGGMSSLEWPLCTPGGYVKTIIPITTSAYHTAWGISWGETQRRCITADAAYKDGWYNPIPSSQPIGGLGAARMIGMLTYRSHESFETRFSRRPVKPKQTPEESPQTSFPTPSPSDSGIFSIQNAGSVEHSADTEQRILNEDDRGPVLPRTCYEPTKFAAQSYLQYQADKFLKRFDANCYIHLTTKMDAHDVTRGRIDTDPDASTPSIEELKRVFIDCPRGALVISVHTDILFTPKQQQELVECLPDATLVNLDSPDGHDGFLLEFDTLNDRISDHLRKTFPEWYEEDVAKNTWTQDAVVSSMFGEVDIEY